MAYSVLHTAIIVSSDFNVFFFHCIVHYSPYPKIVLLNLLLREFLTDL